MSSLVQAASFVSAAALGITYLYLRNAKRSEGAARPSAPQAQATHAAPAGVKPYEATHLSAAFPSDVTYDSPLLARVWPRNANFVDLHEQVIESQVVRRGATRGGSSSASGSPPDGSGGDSVRSFVRAGPVERLYWEPRVARAAIVTCGGLCPGLNTVVREIVLCLHYLYGVDEVFGVPHGYRGFYGKEEWLKLTPDSVSTIHNLGGTVLGSSRGAGDLDKMLAALADRGINMLFVVGGDGTHKGALALVKAAAARRYKISIIGVPKTIDNDIALCVPRAHSHPPLPPFLHVPLSPPPPPHAPFFFSPPLSHSPR